MSIIQEKKGGPYSKNEKMKRQNEVYKLHFEYGYSAVKISEMMKINRNTINSDIKNFYSNIKEEIKQNGEDLILRQIGRLDAQRSRIVESITENKIDDIRYEKLLLEIDGKINELCLKIDSNIQFESNPVDVDEVKIKDIVLFLIIKHSEDYMLRKEDIIREIVNIEHTKMLKATNIFHDMEDLGLNCCRVIRGHEFMYNMLEFAILRKYVLHNDDFVVKIQSLYIIAKNHNEKIIRLEKKFKEENGDKEKWSDEVFEKYESKMADINEKTSEEKVKLVAECLNRMSDKNRIEEYTKCIGMVFGKEEKHRFGQYFD